MGTRYKISNRCWDTHPHDADVQCELQLGHLGDHHAHGAWWPRHTISVIPTQRNVEGDPLF